MEENISNYDKVEEYDRHPSSIRQIEIVDDNDDTKNPNTRRRSIAKHEYNTNNAPIGPGMNTMTSPIEPPPDGGYGWICTGALSLINCFTWGVTASYGVYISHYLAADYFPGATPLDFALIGGLEFGVAMVISPLCTVLTRELGRFAVQTAGVVLFAGGFVAASFAHRIWQLYLSQGVCVGVGLGCIFIPGIQVLPQWFLRRRSLAGGIASAGSGFGGVAFSLGTNAMIERLGLSWTLRITGILCLVGNFMGACLIKDRNAVVKPPQLGFATHLLRRYDCLLLLAWGFTNLFGYMTLLYSLSNYAAQIAGLSQSHASLLTAILNLGTGFGRPALGFLSDYFGRIQTAAFVTFGCAVSVFAIWIPATSFGVIVFFAIIAGSLIGIYWMAVGVLCAEVAGLEEVPSFLSLQWLTTVLPCTFAEVIALYIRKPQNGRWGYLYPQLFAGLAYLVASIFMFELWRVKRKEWRKVRLTIE